MSVPVICVHQRQEREAWSAYQGILLQQRDHPELFHNPAWTILRHDAYERWARLFEVV